MGACFIINNEVFIIAVPCLVSINGVRVLKGNTPSLPAIPYPRFRVLT